MFSYRQEKVKKVDKQNNFLLESAYLLILWYRSGLQSSPATVWGCSGVVTWRAHSDNDILHCGNLILWVVREKTNWGKSRKSEVQVSTVVTLRFHAGIVGVSSIRHPTIIQALSFTVPSLPVSDIYVWIYFEYLYYCPPLYFTGDQSRNTFCSRQLSCENSNQNIFL